MVEPILTMCVSGERMQWERNCRFSWLLIIRTLILAHKRTVKYSTIFSYNIFHEKDNSNIAKLRDTSLILSDEIVTL